MPTNCTLKNKGQNCPEYLKVWKNLIQTLKHFIDTENNFLYEYLYLYISFLPLNI